MDNRIFVLSADMDNRLVEEVARDLANQISDLCDKLVEQDQIRKAENADQRERKI
ncbi:MAG: hypothetical protein PHC41_12735 [Lachnospiraceae bacterium]|jgi:hypothetical protein|nr:hypothetical protein [Lachnospiraceae bacterium]MDD3617073.1 hypothetical protein [Lachnospiraceae bacterium]